MNSVQPDSLPQSYRVKLKDPSRYADMASEFQGRPGIEQVQDSRAIFDRIFSILNAFQLTSLVISLIMVLAALLLIANTIRVAAFTRGARPASCVWSVRPTCRSGCRSCWRR